MKIDTNLRATPSVERPWGWAVVAASFTVHLLIFGLTWSVGIFNLIFLEAFGEPPGVTSWAGSLVLAVLYGGGPVASVLTNKYGCRPVTIAGGLLASAGLCLSHFATSFYVVLGTFGVITGFGCSLTYIPAITIVTYYFDKRRAFAVGLMASGLGFGTFVFPPLTRALFLCYGWRGTMLVLGAIMLNVCVCGAVMRPIHIRELASENRTKLLDLSMFKRMGYLLLCLNNFLVCFGLSIIYVHLPAFGESRGVNSKESALLMSIIGSSNLIGRLSFGYLAQIKILETTAMYASAFGLAGISVGVTPLFYGYISLAVIGALFGFFSGCFGSLLVIILTRLLGVQRVSTGYGLLLIFEGLGSLAGAPFAGWLFDVVHSYDVSLFVGGSAILLSSVAMIGPYVQIRSDANRDVMQLNISVPATERKCMIYDKDGSF